MPDKPNTGGSGIAVSVASETVQGNRLFNLAPYIAKTAQTDKKLKRLTAKRAQNDRLAARIARFPGWEHEAQALAGCASRVIVPEYQFPDGGVVSRHGATHYCKLGHFCQICASRRASRLKSKYQPAIEELTRGLYGQAVTLTLRNTPHLPDRAQLSRWLRNLWRRKFWQRWGGVQGGLYSIETTWNEKEGTFHCHIHALIFLKSPVPCFFNRNWELAENMGLSEEWRKVTKDRGYVVLGQRFDGRTVQTMKYLAKGSELEEMPDAALLEYLQWQRGQNIFASFGCLRGLAETLNALEETVDEEEIDANGEQVEPFLEGLGPVGVTRNLLEWRPELRQYVLVSSEWTPFVDTGPPEEVSPEILDKWKQGSEELKQMRARPWKRV